MTCPKPPNYKASRLWSQDFYLSDSRSKGPGTGEATREPTGLQDPHLEPLLPRATSLCSFLFVACPISPSSSSHPSGSGYSCKGISAGPQRWRGLSMGSQDWCLRLRPFVLLQGLEGIQASLTLTHLSGGISLQASPVFTRGGLGVKQMAVLCATSPPGSVCSVPALWSTSGLGWSSSIGTMWA